MEAIASRGGPCRLKEPGRQAQKPEVLRVLAGSATREGRRTAREEPRLRKDQGGHLPRKVGQVTGEPSKRKQALMGKTGPEESPSHPGRRV